MTWRVRFAIAIAVALAHASCAKDHIVEAGFWFEGVTFDLPRSDIERLGGVLLPDERAQIESTARRELLDAYSGLRIRFSDKPTAFYRVTVVQEIGGRALPAAGLSRRMLPFGGTGSVSFRTVANQAVWNAPRGMTRAQMIEGIGKGIGRTAAHEFAHEIIPRVDIHASRDVDSYEYGSSDRPSQYYGRLHWAFARPNLEGSLGRR